MDFKGKRVLVLEGYARQCLPFLRSLRKHGCHVTLLCGSKLDLGYVSRYADRKILGICDPDRYEASRDCICSLVKTGEYDLVLPLVDFSAGILSENKAELSKYAVIAACDADVFKTAQDKLSVMKICMENDLPCPRTLTGVQSAEAAAAGGLTYPIVVKPRRGCGAQGFHCFRSEEELLAFSGDWEDCVVQEYVPQRNCNLAVNLFIDSKDTVRTAFTYASRRWFPLEGGTGTLNEMVDRPDAVASCEKLAQLLQLRGFVGFDLIDDPRDGIPKIIEVNPRILACAQIGFDAGLDLARLLLEDAFRREVCAQQVTTYGIYSRMTQTDILWLLKSPNRWKCDPPWFRCRRTKDQTFFWDDPLPWFAFLLRGMLRLKKEMDRRS